MTNFIKLFLLLLAITIIVSCDTDDDTVNPTPEQITYGLEITRIGINNFPTLGADISKAEDSLGIKQKTINKPATKDLQTAEDNKMKALFALVLTSAIRSRFVVNGTAYSFIKK